MKVYYVKDRSIIYIIAAIVCLSVIFTGIRIIDKFQKQEKVEKTVEVVELSVFTDLITNSNTFFGSVYKKKYDKESFFINIKSKITGKLKIDKNLIKTQLPAIINMAEEPQLSSRGSKKDLDKNEETFHQIEGDTDYKALGDISFIDEEEVIEVGNLGISKEKALEKIKNIDKPKSISIAKDKPYIMIYHTHATEAYLPNHDGGFRSRDKNYNMIKIGDIITEKLIEKGHRVKHIETTHDYPSYNASYSRARSTIEKELKGEKNLRVLIDIHRDGVSPGASYYDRIKKESVVQIDGKKVGTFKFVVGNDTPNKDKVLQFANYIKSVSDMMYPGLCLKPIIKPYGKFNQYLSDYSLLMEVGSNVNTLEETERTADYISEILDVALKGMVN
ncbi:stage II sporulation protein P [Senegalia massiliensis]|uniref:stage II sporulation protein P n=1 Tax=Senegalia massiliensis TaxID=1720316 RepID=UPI0010312EB5|nr:stage II sporulation protein P [Senegalia massiliensis]